MLLGKIPILSDIAFIICLVGQKNIWIELFFFWIFNPTLNEFKDYSIRLAETCIIASSVCALLKYLLFPDRSFPNLRYFSHSCDHQYSDKRGYFSDHLGSFSTHLSLVFYPANSGTLFFPDSQICLLNSAGFHLGFLVCATTWDFLILESIGGLTSFDFCFSGFTVFYASCPLSWILWFHLLFALWFFQMRQ